MWYVESGATSGHGRRHLLGLDMGQVTDIKTLNGANLRRHWLAEDQKTC